MDRVSMGSISFTKAAIQFSDDSSSSDKPSQHLERKTALHRPVALGGHGCSHVFFHGPTCLLLLPSITRHITIPAAIFSLLFCFCLFPPQLRPLIWRGFPGGGGGALLVFQIPAIASSAKATPIHNKISRDHGLMLTSHRNAFTGGPQVGRSFVNNPCPGLTRGLWADFTSAHLA